MRKERYQPVLTSVWTDEKFIHFNSDTKLLWLYLLTCKHSNMIGLFNLPKTYIASDLGWVIERVSEPLGILYRNGMIEYDENTQMILLVNNLKHRPIEGPKQLIGAKKVLDELPETLLFKRFNEITDTLSEGYRKGLERVSKPLRLPKPVSCIRKPVTVTESEAVKTPLSAKNADGDRFAQFWAQYPRHEKRKNAFEAFKRLNLKNETFEKIMESLSKQKLSDQWIRDDGKYIPHPTTWLNGHRWEDDIKNCIPDKPETAFDRSQQNIKSFKNKMGIKTESPESKKIEGKNYGED